MIRRLDAAVTGYYSRVDQQQQLIARAAAAGFPFQPDPLCDETLVVTTVAVLTRLLDAADTNPNGGQ